MGTRLSTCPIPFNKLFHLKNHWDQLTRCTPSNRKAERGTRNVNIWLLARNIYWKLRGRLQRDSATPPIFTAVQVAFDVRLPPSSSTTSTIKILKTS